MYIFQTNIPILYGHSIPMDILPYGHFLIHQICMDISLLWTICHMVFLHIDHYFQLGTPKPTSFPIVKSSPQITGNYGFTL